MKRLTKTLISAAVPMLLAGCASLPAVDSKEPPTAFHDTRLQYALVTGETETLRQEFGMALPPSWAERVAAGAVLPVTAATEAAFWPVFIGIKAFAPSQH